MSDRRDIALAALALGVASVLVLVCLQSQRAVTDAAFTQVTLLGMQQRLSADTSGSPVPDGMFDPLVAMNVDVYLSSDTARRSAAGEGIRRAWLAYRTAHFIENSRSHGATEPPLTDVPTASEALATFPDLARFVATSGEPRFVNAEALSHALFDNALLETDAAMAANLEQHPDYAPNLAPLP
jgi:hypothetical protein